MPKVNSRKNGRSVAGVLPGLIAAAMMLAACGGDAGAAQPVVVELFQSQGCSSCPPANANVNVLADRADVLALSFGVTYWDQLGWKDTFATPENTARQWDYAHGSLHHSNVFTPQVVINGRSDVVGIDRKELERAVAGATPPTGPALSISGAALSIGAGSAPATDADVWLVRYDPRVVEVAIRRGENGGRTLPHRNIVRALVRLGSWSGAAQQYVLPPSPDAALRTAILVQGKQGGPIISALKL
jgi:hypothetical protein